VSLRVTCGDCAPASRSSSKARCTYASQSITGMMRRTRPVSSAIRAVWEHAMGELSETVVQAVDGFAHSERGRRVHGAGGILQRAPRDSQAGSYVRPAFTHHCHRMQHGERVPPTRAGQSRQRDSPPRDDLIAFDATRQVNARGPVKAGLSGGRAAPPPPPTPVPC
jgi:hypothetical protein